MTTRFLVWLEKQHLMSFYLFQVLKSIQCKILTTFDLLIFFTETTENHQKKV